ncbi:MAG: serpin family protein [Ilumatobacteraceae bacterium]|nr:serpin family protein [Ilumatobacteraceae bacterium]
MERRTFLALLSTPVLLAALEACGSSKSTSSTNRSNDHATTPSNDTPPSTVPTGSTAPTTPQTATSTTDAGVATATVNRFGTDLYARLAAADPNAPNLVFSPASVAIALAMVLPGAHGATAEQLAATLHADVAAALAPSMHALLEALDGRTETVDNPAGDPIDVVLAIANSLWVQQGFDLESSYLDALSTEFGAAPQSVDYRADPETARTLINTWVETATHDRIPALLPPGAVSAATTLTLVNAVYMKAPWRKTFDRSSTAPAPFTTLAAAAVQTDAMSVVDFFGYVARSGVQMVALPYIGDDLSMLIALPDAGQPLSAAVAALGDPRGLASTRVAVTLPKFDIETSVGVGEAVAALGAVDLFDPAKADLTGIATADPPLYVGAIIHQANITVDEDGTEAAAATAVLLAGGAAVEAEPIDFRVDRPFAFAVRDDPTGAILFLGHVGDPTQRRG